MTTEYNMEDNIKHLQSGMFYLGFTDKYNEEIAAKMKTNEPSFTISPETPAANFEIEFKRGEGQEWMNIAGHRATLNEAPDKTQYFSVFKNKGTTAREAVNLLEGRAVQKTRWNDEGEKYEVWQQLDFSKKTERGNYETNSFSQKYGFNIEASFKQIDFAKPMPEWTLGAIKKGDEITGIVTIDKTETEVKLIANPAYRVIEGQSADGTRLFVASSKAMLTGEQMADYLVKQEQYAAKAQTEQKNAEQMRAPERGVFEQPDQIQRPQQAASKEDVSAEKKKVAEPSKNNGKQPVEKIPKPKRPPLENSATTKSKKR